MTVLFETSFEVCNKVGGIHTVLATKAAILKEKYDEYYLIGPYFSNMAAIEFTEQKVPSLLLPLIDTLAKQGIYVRYGKWLVGGSPNVFLLDFAKQFDYANDFKKTLFERYGVESLNGGYDYTEPLVFSLAAAKLIVEYTKLYPQKQVISHAHEWITGFTNLHLRHTAPKVATVFTTHATILGRALCGAGVDLYAVMDKIDPYVEAKKCGVLEKFTAERASAKYSHIFTTVSDITAKESKALLGRTPEVLVYNGLDFTQFPTYQTIGSVFTKSRNELHNFIRYFYFPYQFFDLDQTQIFFTSGRFEFSNKGFDVEIAALAKLNRALIAQKSKKTVVVFFFSLMGHGNVRADVMEQKLKLKHLTRLVKENQKASTTKIVDSYITKTPLACDEQFNQDIAAITKTLVKSGNPPLSTHDVDYKSQPFIALANQQLTNAATDRVKVVVVPSYINGTDGLFDLPYYELSAGFDLGIFASKYEPWGYTPLEGNAVGVPIVTTDAAGYGQFSKNSPSPAAVVLNRLATTDAVFVDGLANYLQSFLSLTNTQLSTLRMQAQIHAQVADWQNFITHYITAHKLAINALKNSTTLIKYAAP